MVANSVAEEWRPVLGYEAWYSVSNMGRVRRDAPGNNNQRGHVLRPHRSKQSGYCAVSLCVNGVVRVRKVHALVLEAFVGPRPPKHEPDHIDGVRWNNMLSNLRWLTKRQNNLATAERHGGAPWHRGVNGVFAKLTEEQVTEIRMNKLTRVGRGWQKDMARRFGVCEMTISNAALGKTYCNMAMVSR